jgi:hypothetical protein
MRFHGGRHTFEGTFSRSDKKRVVGSIPGSTDARCWTNQIAAATLSTGSQFATDKRFRWQRLADSREVARPWDSGDTLATTAPTAATFFPASTQTDHTNCNAYLPPCVKKNIPVVFYARGGFCVQFRDRPLSTIVSSARWV